MLTITPACGMQMSRRDLSPAERRASVWIARVHSPRHVRLRLFCFPYAGAGPQIFAPWAKAFPEGVEICPIQLPGRGLRLREPPFTRLAPLVEAVREGIAPALDVPFMLLGHSLGALVAFELARSMRRHLGPAPVQLIVSACRAPQLPHTHPVIHDLPDDRFIHALRELNGTPEEFLRDSGAFQLIVPALRADLAAFETYEYRPDAPFDCPIRAFGGLADDRAPAEQLRAWRAQTTGDFTMQCLPGGHFFIHQTGALLVRLLATVTYEALRDAR